MKIIEKGNYLWLMLDGPTDFYDASNLLNWSRKKGDNYIRVEDNLVNRLILNMPLDIYEEHQAKVDDLKFYELLKDYQIKDVAQMLHVTHSLNANPMGLGKTVEAIKFLEALKIQNALIVTPKIIMEQWVDQLDRWAGIQAEIYNGQKTLKKDRVYIVNYEKLINPRTIVKFKSFRWDVLILDEAHRIKNRNSKRTLACKDIPAGRKLALTGTPILRYVDDLWSILNFLDPRYSGSSYWSFLNYFCKMQHTPWGDKIVGITENPARVLVLNKLLKLVCIRNDAIQVAHGKTTEVVRLKMEKEQRELYRKEKQLLLDELPDNCTIANGAVLTLRLMQTTSWPGLFIEGLAGPKFEWVYEACINNPEEKFVVFSVFEKSASALVEYLKSKNVQAVAITGKNTNFENAQHKNSFLRNKKTQVLVGTIKAMGQGYDELQTVSRLMIFLDRDWSPEIMAQAEDRLNRMGQKYPVNIYYLECQASFDQHVGRINLNKAEDIKEALKRDGDNS